MILIGIMTSCKDFDHYFSSPDETEGPENTEETTSVRYYIKHSWGSGADSDWEWMQMEKESNGCYTYEGLYGGVGANINTKADDNGALWFNRNSISGALELAVSDVVKFSYYPSSKTLTVAKIRGGGDNNSAQVRFYREKAYYYCTALAIEQHNEFVAQYIFADKQAGYSSYFYVPSGTSYPYYYNGDTWKLALDYPYTHYFEAGEKYTFECSDNGSYFLFSIISEGYYNAPQRVVVSRIPIK